VKVAGQVPSRVLVVGLGRSGKAAARLAARDGAEVWVTDQRPEHELGGGLQELPIGARRFLGGHPEECLDGVGLVISSPGVAPGAPILEAARRAGIEVCAEVEFAWRHAADRPLAAVTGSNGKSTVTELIARMLSASGIRTVAGGNLGTAASDLAVRTDWQCWVLEVSSFQAEMLSAMKPDVGVFLNLSQDHLERHPDMAGYLAAKRRLFEFQDDGDAVVLNADDDAVAATVTRARRLHFSLASAADAWFDGDALRLGERVLMERARIPLGGLHNVANALAAVLASVEVGASIEAMIHTLETFRGLEHRHRTVHEERGVRWVDDSKATNVGAAIAALRGYPERSVHLILGGQAKGQDFRPILGEVQRSTARVYLIGVDGPAIGAVLADAAPIEDCGTLEEAVARARNIASEGQWVLLAPACASFDQFSGFAERGDRFTALARREEAPCP
jgi:UDP-N-acetylmuramoylalanine--D-glutamate ligase